jgi:glycosyltransferase involved in cell wall biosynthesis
VSRKTRGSVLCDPVQVRAIILTQHFTPEVTAARTRLEAFAEGLAARGHEVEVICEVPNHPEGVIRPGYRHRAVVRRTLDGFRVKYVWVHARPTKSFRNRVLFYGTYAAMASVVGAVARRPDVILASSPPLPTGAAAALVATRHRVPWVLDVRDLWPEAAVILGELRGARAIALAERLEARLYRSAAAITTTTEPFRRRIAGHLDDPGKVELVPNGTTRAWLAAGEADADPAALRLPADRFVWLYAGNLGVAQGLDSAIEAARLLGDGFQLLLLGDGPRRERLQAQAAVLPAGAVAFHGLVQPDIAARYMRAADALLVPLDARPELEQFVPSKLFDCCAVGRPVILAARGEAPRLAADADAALVVPPGDPVALADAVRRLLDEPRLAGRLSEAGRSFAAGYLREDQIQKLEGILARVVGERA